MGSLDGLFLLCKLFCGTDLFLSALKTKVGLVD